MLFLASSSYATKAVFQVEKLIPSMRLYRAHELACWHARQCDPNC
jgi:hypothetical protein